MRGDSTHRFEGLRAIAKHCETLKHHLISKRLPSPTVRDIVDARLVELERASRFLAGSIVQSSVVISSLDTDFCLSVRHILAVDGFATELAMGPAETIAAIQERTNVGLLVDGQPDFALGLCRVLKEDSSTRHVRIVTLLAAEQSHRFAQFLDVGVEEAFMRPLEPDRYLRALKRLVGNHHSSPASAGLERLNHSGLIVDARTHRILFDGHDIHLGPVEFELLRVMISDPGRVFKRDELASGAWPKGVFVDPRTVNVHIGRLRKALTPIMKLDVVRTVRGIGYALESNPF